MKDKYYFHLTNLRTITFGHLSLKPCTIFHRFPTRGKALHCAKFICKPNLKGEKDKRERERKSEITFGPRQRRLPAARCGPHPSSTSSRHSRCHMHPTITDGTFCRLTPLRTIGIENFLPETNLFHSTLSAHVFSPGQAGLNAWCPVWLAPVKATTGTKREGDSRKEEQRAKERFLRSVLGPQGHRLSSWCVYTWH